MPALGASRLERDGDVAAFGGGEERGKGKHVGGLILAAELQVEALKFSVAGEQDIDLTGESGSTLSLAGKARKSEAAEVFRFSSF